MGYSSVYYANLIAEGTHEDYDANSHSCSLQSKKNNNKNVQNIFKTCGVRLR